MKDRGCEVDKDCTRRESCDLNAFQIERRGNDNYAKRRQEVIAGVGSIVGVEWRRIRTGLDLKWKGKIESSGKTSAIPPIFYSGEQPQYLLK